MLNKIRASQIYDEALSFHSAKEFLKALPFMQEASALGHPQAMSILGTMYLLGQGVKEDGRQAEFWLKKSIDAGSILGMAYATGKAGVKIDFEKANSLLTKAAESGDHQSAKMLEMMHKGEGIFARSPHKNKLH